MSTFEQVLELIQHLNAEEIAELRERLEGVDLLLHQERPQRVLGLHAHMGKHWISPDFNGHLGDDFWLGDENDPLYR